MRWCLQSVCVCVCVCVHVRERERERERERCVCVCVCVTVCASVCEKPHTESQLKQHAASGISDKSDGQGRGSEETNEHPQTSKQTLVSLTYSARVWHSTFRIGIVKQFAPPCKARLTTEGTTVHSILSIDPDPAFRTAFLDPGFIPLPGAWIRLSVPDSGSTSAPNPESAPQSVS